MAVAQTREEGSTHKLPQPHPDREGGPRELAKFAFPLLISCSYIAWVYDLYDLVCTEWSPSLDCGVAQASFSPRSAGLDDIVITREAWPIIMVPEKFMVGHPTRWKTGLAELLTDDYYGGDASEERDGREVSVPREKRW